MDGFHWLQEWFEHNSLHEQVPEKLLTLSTLDNPGWILKVKVEETDLENRPFSNLQIDREDWDWYHCFVREGRFLGAGGSRNLVEILDVFQTWSRQEPVAKEMTTELIEWLEDWYTSQCNEDWEHCYGIHMWSLPEKGWHLDVGVRETELEDIPFTPVGVKRSDTDWYRCWVENYKFYGLGGLHNLTDMIQVFREWAEPEQRRYESMWGR